MKLSEADEKRFSGTSIIRDVSGTSFADFRSWRDDFNVLADKYGKNEANPDALLKWSSYKSHISVQFSHQQVARE